MGPLFCPPHPQVIYILGRFPLRAGWQPRQKPSLSRLSFLSDLYFICVEIPSRGCGRLPRFLFFLLLFGSCKAFHPDFRDSLGPSLVGHRLFEPSPPSGRLFGGSPGDPVFLPKERRQNLFFQPNTHPVRPVRPRRLGTALFFYCLNWSRDPPFSSVLSRHPFPLFGQVVHCCASESFPRLFLPSGRLAND